MTAIKANGITIEYEEMGLPGAPVILLIMGLGMQLIAWPEPFCEGLAARGFRIVRFDNRDAGLSTRMPSVGSLASAAMMARAFLGLPVQPPYTLDDMARDTVGLMDALGIDQAHVVGASMGGMIAQIVAIEHPERVRSLTSIMSTSGDRALPGPNGNVRRALLRRRPRDKALAVNGYMEMFRLHRRRPTPADGGRASRQGRASGGPQLSARRFRAPVDRHPGRAKSCAEASRRSRADPGRTRLPRSAGPVGRRGEHRRQYPRSTVARGSRDGSLSAPSTDSAACR